MEVENKPICTVRLRTTTWADKRGLHIHKNITYLRKQCIGHNVLEEDTGAIDAKDIIKKIINLNECEDGVYTVSTCNEKRDWQTGYVDDYNYLLIPAAQRRTP